jgi:hypothetical protein
MQPGEGVERRRVGAGLWFDLVEEVAGVDERIGADGDYPVDGGEEVVVDELFTQVHPGLRVDAAERR